MATQQYGRMVVWNRHRALLSLDEVAARCHLHPSLLKRFVTLGLIDPVEASADLFQPDVILRLQRILRLRRDLGINYNAAGLVLDLLERIDALETELRQFQRRA
jgi:DNA-binding transcriptional MerR regulator